MIMQAATVHATAAPHRWRQKALVLACAGALAACSPLPPTPPLADQAVARQALAQAGFEQARGPAVSPGLVPDRWWQLYADPALDSLVQQGLQANTGLREARAHLQRAHAIVQAVDAEAGPHASVEAAGKRAQEAGETFLLKEKLPVMNEGNLGFSVSYQIDLFGQLARAEEAAHASQQATAAALDVVRVSVAAATVRAYVQGCSATHELHRAEAALAVQQRRLELARRLAEAGRSPRTAVQQRRPDVREAERLLAAATARIGVATAALYPSIHLGASAGLSGVLGDLGNAATARWGLGPLISWQIPDNAARARVQASQADAQAALDEVALFLALGGGWLQQSPQSSDAH